MDINELRKNIDVIDDKLLALFCERLNAADEIAEYKNKNSLPVADAAREKEILERLSDKCGEGYGEAIRRIYQTVFAVSRSRQIGRFGLIGGTLAHSASKQLHALFGDYNYEMLELDESGARDVLLSRSFDGLNVTVPHKILAFGLCDELSPSAESAGSVNTVILKNGRLFGYNTDCYGFKFLLDYNDISLQGKKALILGSGGASRAVQAVCREANAEMTVISREGKNNYGNIDRFYDSDIVINATPVGMFPDCGKAPVDISRFTNCQAVVDLIYNPLKTNLMLDAQACGIKAVGGLMMLCAQGRAASELFTGKKISDAETVRIYNRLLFLRRNIVLIGMPGCGKTLLGKQLAASLGREFLDIDAGVQKMTGKSPAEIITQCGEKRFRAAESEVAAEYGALSGKVIACGGGTPLSRENRRNLSRNALTVFIDAPLDSLDISGRPLSQGVSLEKMYAERMPLYKEMCDITIGAAKDFWRDIQ